MNYLRLATHPMNVAQEGPDGPSIGTSVKCQCPSGYCKRLT